MSVITINQGHFQTAELHPSSDANTRVFTVSGITYDAVFMPANTPGNRLEAGTRPDADSRIVTFQLKLNVLDPNNPARHDGVLRDIILGQKPWILAKENCIKLQHSMCPRLLDNNRADPLKVFLAYQIGGEGGKGLVDDVINKDLRAARILDTVDQRRQFDPQWFVEKKKAAKEAVVKIKTAANLQIQEFRRLRHIGQLHTTPPVVQGFSWEEQLYHIAIACTVACFSYDLDVTV